MQQSKLTGFFKRKETDWVSDHSDHDKKRTNTNQQEEHPKLEDTPSASRNVNSPERIGHVEPPNTTLKNKMDVGNFLKRDNNKDILDSFQSLWYPSTQYKFPVLEKYKDKKLKLKFQHKWFLEFDWLVYSEKEQGAFCKYCVFFATGGGINSQELGALVKRKFDNWKKAIEVFKGHQLHKYHIESIHAYENVKKIAEGKSEKVINLIDTDRKKKAKENRKKLTPIIEGIIVCGQQELALRGHRDYGKIDVDNESKTNEGNFRAIVKYRAKGDAEFKNTLDAASKRESYLSPHIQNEIIDCINVILLKQLAAKINKADFFSVLVDETTDIATIEQITLCVRYVVDDSGTHNIREDFLQFVIADGLTGEQLANSILTGLQKCNIDLTNLIGQGYDGANNMSGKFSGVQSVVRRKYPKALYVHCAAHVLNLAISKASSIPQIRNCLSTMERIYDFLKTPKRKNALLKAIDDLEEPVSTKSLKRLCATRWTAKYEAANDFIELYECVVETLRQISTWHDTGDAPMLLTNILDGEFIVAMHIIQQIFNIGLPLSRILQKIDIDLKEAIAATEDAVSTLEKIRSNADDEFKVIFEQSLRIANIVDSEIKIKRTTKRQNYRTNVNLLVNSENPVMDYFRISVYLPYVDFFINELKERFADHKSMFEGFLCLFSKSNFDRNPHSFEELCSLFLPEVSKSCLIAELRLWLERLDRISKGDERAINLLDMCNKTAYPNIHRLLKIFCVLPVSTATPERTFSTLKRLKTYLRNSTSQNRLNGLAMMTLHREMLIDIDEVIDELAKKPRRLDFVL